MLLRPHLAVLFAAAMAVAGCGDESDPSGTACDTAASITDDYVQAMFSNEAEFEAELPRVVDGLHDLGDEVDELEEETDVLADWLSGIDPAGDPFERVDEASVDEAFAAIQEWEADECRSSEEPTTTADEPTG